MFRTKNPRALTIAGSDSGGGAGIQADLKTFAALGVYGASVITALTAQNTRDVRGIHGAPPEFVRLQLDTVLSDIAIGAVKTGMLLNAAIVETVAEGLRAHRVRRVVLDPVMVSKHGRRLLEAGAVTAVRELLAPMATVITPNAMEAALLARMRRVETLDDMKRAAGKILQLGSQSVLIKGGHAGSRSRAVDFWTDGHAELELDAPRLRAIHTHGTGCALSAALAAHLAMGHPLMEAVYAAKHFITGAIRHGYRVGAGVSPVDHLWMTRA